MKRAEMGYLVRALSAEVLRLLHALPCLSASHTLAGLLGPRFRIADLGFSVTGLEGALSLATLASLRTVSIHLWLALRIRSLVGVFAVGILAVMLSLGFVWSRN